MPKCNSYTNEIQKCSVQSLTAVQDSKEQTFADCFGYVSRNSVLALMPKQD